MTPAPLTPAEREDYSERAGIIEYEAGLSRAEAERQAMALVLAKRNGVAVAVERHRAAMAADGYVGEDGLPIEPVTRGGK